MSQHWHGHWTNDAFKPVRLRNWEVPNWHPCWPDRHCRVTEFVADNRGRLLMGQKKSTVSPWGNFKGTWELPNKISKQTAYELSAPPIHKLKAWEQHKKANKQTCARGETRMKKKKNNSPDNPPSKDVGEDRVAEELEPQPALKSPRIAVTAPKTPCPIHNTCQV